MLKTDEALGIANEDNTKPVIKDINKLLRVALINSYPKGQSHLIEVGDNTIITGRNSAGKTTLMGAVIPFFGTRLSEVSKKNEAVKRLIDFYIPYDDSYLVYEYR
ncbi:ATP-binding protein, partial [Psychrobacter sp. 1Y4]|uniref:ATP-binding protein n=1 Tax=Psychrobacter sp. 1Y4 TaxID=3453575 RepID=UPI003F463DA4